MTPESPSKAKDPGGATAGVLVYVLCSSTMLVINKMAMTALPYSNAMTALQTGVGALLLYVLNQAGLLSKIDPTCAAIPAPTFSKIAAWLPVTAVWIIPISLNMAAMKYLSVETLMMFRSLSIVLVAVGDYFFLGTSLPPRQQGACVIISLGGLIYGSNDLSFNLMGYICGAGYSIAMLVNSIYTKFAFNQNKGMSTWEKSFLNNLVSFPVMLLVMGTVEDVPAVQKTLASLSLLQGTMVFLGCVMGLGISMSGIKCRDLLTATSFDVLGNCTKYATLAINALVLGASTNAVSLAGVLIALTGSALYSPAGAFLVEKLMGEKRKERVA